MSPGWGELFDVVLREFPVDVSHTEPVDVDGLGGHSKVYRVDASSSPLLPENAGIDGLYIIDSKSGMEIACHPHIVGGALEELSLDCAVDFIKAAKAVGVLELEGLALLQILRGSLGYMLERVLPKRVPTVSIRTEYVKVGYRQHGESERVDVTHRDYSRLVREGGDTTSLLIPDTLATGRSAEAALRDVLESEVGLERVVTYGFTAIPALIRLGGICYGRGIELYGFSICDVSQLASNNYDMPVYGPDEGLYGTTGELRQLGSIIDAETLGRFLPRYVAGLDQPGDWSERQDQLFNGQGNESGDIAGHLRKSIGLIESLRNINSGRPWYDDVQDGAALRELEKLREKLDHYS